MSEADCKKNMIVLDIENKVSPENAIQLNVSSFKFQFHLCQISRFAAWNYFFHVFVFLPLSIKLTNQMADPAANQQKKLGYDHHAASAASVDVEAKDT